VIVYPAIDIRGGRCVRLVEGDFARETVYDADPVTAARRWADAGAEWLHVVDLDGAVAGAPVNHETIGRLRQAVDLPMQVGGGLRRLDDIERLLASGVTRAILGTVALREPELVHAAVAQWGDRIAVGLDARDGKLAASGWLEQSEVGAIAAAQQLAAAGVATFIFTDISRDGQLSGPNLASLGELIEAVDAAIIASGGIGTLADLRATAQVGAGGTIVGRALYDHRIDLREAIAVTRLSEVQP
jgi:phosphoribosylformimino-5-aminoimidazole carboxamide ribotide isomerase